MCSRLRGSTAFELLSLDIDEEFPLSLECPWQRPAGLKESIRGEIIFCSASANPIRHAKVELEVFSRSLGTWRRLE
jgi:hypothetical protein